MSGGSDNLRTETECRQVCPIVNAYFMRRTLCVCARHNFYKFEQTQHWPCNESDGDGDAKKKFEWIFLEYYSRPSARQATHDLYVHIVKHYSARYFALVKWLLLFTICFFFAFSSSEHQRRRSSTRNYGLKNWINATETELKVNSVQCSIEEDSFTCSPLPLSGYTQFSAQTLLCVMIYSCMTSSVWCGSNTASFATPAKIIWKKKMYFVWALVSFLLSGLKIWHLFRRRRPLVHTLFMRHGWVHSWWKPSDDCPIASQFAWNFHSGRPLKQKI